eukprot:sb/3469512/
MRPAVNLIMGANIGTTVTNTIVSLGQSMDRKQFRRAFAGATVHDCFNWLCVSIFLPLEAIFHPIERLSHLIVRGIDSEPSEESPDFFSVLTDPFTTLIIQMDTKSVLDKIAIVGLSDVLTGLLLLAISLVMLILCLTVLVKILQSLLMGSVAGKLKKNINSNLPGPFKPLTGGISATKYPPSFQVHIPSDRNGNDILAAKLQCIYINPHTLGGNWCDKPGENVSPDPG